MGGFITRTVSVRHLLLPRDHHLLKGIQTNDFKKDKEIFKISEFKLTFLNAKVNITVQAFLAIIVKHGISVSNNAVRK